MTTETERNPAISYKEDDFNLLRTWNPLISRYTAKKDGMVNQVSRDQGSVTRMKKDTRNMMIIDDVIPDTILHY